MSMKKKIWKQAGAAALAAVVLGNLSGFPGGGLVTGYAAESEAASVTPIAEYTAAELEAFKDNTLEYWEIPGLIEHYNTAYLNQLETYYYNPDGSTGLTKDQLTYMAANLRAEAADLQDELDDMELKKTDDLYQDYMSNIKTLKRYAKEMEDALKGSASTRRALRIVKNQMTVEVSGKMRNYQALAVQDEIQQKNLEIAELAYNSAARQMQLGLYSKENLLAATDSLNAAKGLANSSAAAVVQARQDLITALGWGYDGNPEIMTVPEPDETKISGYDLTPDMYTAISCNYDISDLRKTDSSDLGGVSEKNRQIREMEDKVRMQLEYLYKDVLQKQASYSAAQKGWAAAETNKALADRKYSLGMLSKQEYLAEEVTWLTAKASKEQAGMDLTAAMETYEWALKGLMEL